LNHSLIQLQIPQRKIWHLGRESQLLISIDHSLRLAYRSAPGRCGRKLWVTEACDYNSLVGADLAQATATLVARPPLIHRLAVFVQVSTDLARNNNIDGPWLQITAYESFARSLAAESQNAIKLCIRTVHNFGMV
jgi:hypothetical protein